MVLSVISINALVILMLPNVALLNYCLMSCALVLIRQEQTDPFYRLGSIRRKHRLMYGS